MDLVYSQKLHHIVEQEPVVKYITWGLTWEVLLVEALTQGIAQQQNPLEVLIVVLHIVAHIELHIKVILLVESDSRDHSTAHPSGLSIPSDKTEEAYSKGHHPPRHISDHPPTTPPRPTSGA